MNSAIDIILQVTVVAVIAFLALGMIVGAWLTFVSP